MASSGPLNQEDSHYPSGQKSRRDLWRGPRLLLHWQIVIGLVFGVVAGLIANASVPRQSDGSPNESLEWMTRNLVEPVGQIFLRLIFMIVVPLVFCALALGVAGIGNVRRLGRMGLKTLLLTIVLSCVSVAIGLSLANSLQPGMRLPEAKRAELRERYAPRAATAIDQAKQAKSVRDTLLDIIPQNPLQEMVGALDGSSPGGGMLSVMFFALVVGVAIAVSPERTATLVGVLEGGYEVAMTIIGFAMRLAPFGVAALVFSLAALLGMDIFPTLGWYSRGAN